MNLLGMKKRQCILCWSSFLCILFKAFTGFAADAFLGDVTFERMWPQVLKTSTLNSPGDVAVDNDGFMYVVDTGNFRVQKYTADGRFVSSWGVRGTGRGEFVKPTDIAFHPDGYVYVSEGGDVGSIEGRSRVQKFTLSGEWVSDVGEWGDFGEWGEPGYEYRVPGGIAVAGNGDVYVADVFNNKIRKFTSTDEFVASWPIYFEETWTEDELQLEDVAVEPDGNVLILVHFDLDALEDKICHPVQRFAPDGALIGKWELPLSMVSGICTDEKNSVYISNGHQIKVYSKEGELIKTLGHYGTGDGEFNSVQGVSLDKEGNLYIADTDNHRIQKMTSRGNFITVLGSSGVEPGQFVNPYKITVGGDEKIYVADSTNDRIQVFESDGTFFREIPTGEYVTAVAVDDAGYIYTTHPWSDVVRKYRPGGEKYEQWESAGDINFHDPVDVVFSKGYLYVADELNHRICKLTPEGVLVTQWGSHGVKQGEFVDIRGLDVAPDGSVFVLDDGGLYVEVEITSSSLLWVEVARVQKFSANGDYLTSWGAFGSGEGEFLSPVDVAVDSHGAVYVADGGNYRIQKFTSTGEFIEAAGSQGTEPGMFATLRGLALDSRGRLYTTEEGTNRVQVFSSPMTSPDEPDNPDGADRAIIVAAGGPYPGNTLWDATQMCANFAYRTLLYQGYSKDNILYLSWDTDLDLDGNALLDDVDAVPSGDALQNALTSWAAGSENLLVYMIDHGGTEQFRMGEFELLSAGEFNNWFVQGRQKVSGKTVLLYDACRSGSFLPVLASPSENPPIVIASTAGDENAYFTANGALSFSYLFWANIQNGMTLMDAFISTKNAIEYTYVAQTPLLDDNGNGIGNEDTDGYATVGVYLGNGTLSAGDAPSIRDVSPDMTLNGDTSAVISASGVFDSDGISRVWAVITPPNFLAGGPESPVIHLPSIDLVSTGTNTYEASYNGFTVSGKYRIAVYAEDKLGSISLPGRISITQSGGDTSGTMSDDLFQFRLPCINLDDNCLELTFEMDRTMSAGFFYTPVLETMSGVPCALVCAETTVNYDIFVPGISWQGSSFSFNLVMRSDLPGGVWELDLGSIKYLP